MRCSVRIPTWTPAILTEGFLVYPQTLQAEAGMKSRTIRCYLDNGSIVKRPTKEDTSHFSTDAEGLDQFARDNKCQVRPITHFRSTTSRGVCCTNTGSEFPSVLCKLVSTFLAGFRFNKTRTGCIFRSN